MFLRWDNAKSTPQLEIMVWGGNNSWPIGLQTGTNVLKRRGWTFDCGGNNSLRVIMCIRSSRTAPLEVPNLPTSGNVTLT